MCDSMTQQQEQQHQKCTNGRRTNQLPRTTFTRMLFCGGHVCQTVFKLYQFSDQNVNNSVCLLLCVACGFQNVHQTLCVRYQLFKRLLCSPRLGFWNVHFFGNLHPWGSRTLLKIDLECKRWFFVFVLVGPMLSQLSHCHFAPFLARSARQSWFFSRAKFLPVWARGLLI